MKTKKTTKKKIKNKNNSNKYIIDIDQIWKYYCIFAKIYFIASGIFLLFLFIIYPAYLSAYGTIDNSKLYSTAGYYYPKDNVIYLKIDGKFEIINSTSNLTMEQKIYFHHEKCHQEQHHDDRYYINESPGGYLNEIECYIRGYLFI